MNIIVLKLILVLTIFTTGINAADFTPSGSPFVKTSFNFTNLTGEYIYLNLKFETFVNNTNMSITTSKYQLGIADLTTNNLFLPNFFFQRNPETSKLSLYVSDRKKGVILDPISENYLPLLTANKNISINNRNGSYTFTA